MIVITLSTQGLNNHDKKKGLCFFLKILGSNLLAFCVKYHVRAWKDFLYQNVIPTFTRNYLSWLGFCQLETSSSYLGKGASSEKIPLPDWLLGKPM